MTNDKSLTADEARLLIDCLVSGDVEDGERKRLLAWLEAAPARWRLCGKAFLEAQAWSAALAGSGETDEPAPKPADLPLAAIHAEKPSYSDRRFPAAFVGGGLALALLLAFGGGFVMRGWTSRPEDIVAKSPVELPAAGPDDTSPSDAAANQAMMASVPLRSALSSGSSATLQIPVTPASDKPANQSPRDIPDHVRRQWEQRGYRVWQERRYLAAKLSDGQPVMVPIDQLRTEYVGVPVN